MLREPPRASPASADGSAEETVVAYHERTKHHYGRFAASIGYMDWATQPNPFRRYDGAVLEDLQSLNIPFVSLKEGLDLDQPADGSNSQFSQP